MNKAKEIRDSCQLTCICKTCGNEQGGVCALGSCESAQEMDRCPLTECHYCVGGKVTTIADKARELREAFKEQYGVEASISIDIFCTDNPQMSREDAERLGGEITKAFPGTSEMGHREGERSKWFRVDPPREERVEITLFYKEDANEQSN